MTGSLLSQNHVIGKTDKLMFTLKPDENLSRQVLQSLAHRKGSQLGLGCVCTCVHALGESV